MADFTSAFWSWYVAILTVASIAACFLLNRWLIEPKRKAEEKPKTMPHVWDGDLQEFNNPLPRWWVNLFYLTLVFSVVYLLLYPGLGAFAGALGWSSTGEYKEEMAAADKQFGPLYQKYLQQDLQALATNVEAIKTGQRLFVNYCSTCHGADARGARGFPNLRDQDWQWGGEAQTIKTTILDGRNGLMPAWGPALGREGVFNVSEYVISLSGKRSVNKDAAAAGKAKFTQLCVACHGPEGKGNKQLGAPNLTDDVWLYGSTQKDIMETIEKGRSGRMPAHKDFLGEGKAHMLAAYVYSLSAGK